MFFKKLKKTFIFGLLSLFIIPTSVFAYSEYVIPGGENIGIEINAKGVMIVGLYKVNDSYPATDAGLQVGDMITSVDGNPVHSINEMVEKINAGNHEYIDVEFIRGQESKMTQLKLYKDEKQVYKTGLYVKDSITGIGTLTFIDPNSKIFGALGHEIIEKTSGQILEIRDGKIFDTEVIGVDPSSEGVPGEKNAKFYMDDVNGTIKENTNKGLFGVYTDELPDKTLYKVAKSSDIQKGSAKILTVLDGNTIKEYDINITKINDNNQKIKNLMFEITDEELLQTAGGVVQGMSGSPIIQGDFIVGAVTHVVVDSPTKGYGIFITNMLEEAEN